MKNLEKLDLERIMEIFIYASTPRYLYKHLKGNNSVRLIAESNSTEELITTFKSKLNEITIFESALQLYAILIALTFKSYLETKLFFQSLTSEKFRWVKEISEICLSDFQK